MKMLSVVLTYVYLTIYLHLLVVSDVEGRTCLTTGLSTLQVIDQHFSLFCIARNFMWRAVEQLVLSMYVVDINKQKFLFFFDL